MDVNPENLLALIPTHILAKQRNNTQRVVDLCEEIGYGFVMKEAERQWRLRDPMGSFVVGPCRAFTEACGCDVPNECDDCHACGWIFR